MSAPKDSETLEAAVTDLRTAIGQLVRRLRTEVNPGGLTWSQAATFARLGKSGWMTTAELARAEAVKPQSMAATLASLEQDGLVQRKPHPTDGRQVLFALTDAGVEARRQRNIAKRDWLMAAMARLDAEERQILIGATALIKRLSDS